MKNICSQCSIEDHEKCNLITIEKANNNFVECLRMLEEKKKIIKSKILRRKEAILNDVKFEFESFEKDLEDNYLKERDSLIELLKKNPMNFCSTEVNDNWRKKFKVDFENSMFKSGIKITKKNISKCNKFNIYDFEDDLKKQNIDYKYMNFDEFLGYTHLKCIFFEFSLHNCNGFLIRNLNLYDIDKFNLIIEKHQFIVRCRLCNLSIEKYWSCSFFKSLKKSAECLQTISFYKIHFSDVINEILQLFNSVKFTMIQFIYIRKKINFSNILKSIENSSSRIITLHFRFCNLTKYECSIIGDICNKCSSIQDVNFTGNKNMGNAVDHIFKGLKRSSKNLQVINFNNCDLDRKNIDMLDNLLSSCPAKEKVFLQENPRIKLQAIILKEACTKVSSNLVEFIIDEA